MPDWSPMDVGDRVRVVDGTFAGMTGRVVEVIHDDDVVNIEIIIFGRPVPVRLGCWQVEAA
jgi:transcriptional antiterminator NusG